MGIDVTQVRMRPAAGLERRAALMLLPEGVRQRPWNDYWLAVCEKPLRILASAASFRSIAPDGRPQLHVDIHVAAAHRRQGIGRAMIERLREEARVRHTLSLVTSIDSLQDDGPHRFLVSLGFTLTDRLSTFEADTERLAAFVLPRCAWLKSRGEVPDSARVVPLREADLPSVARLHVAHLSGTYEGILEGLRSRLAGPTAGDNCVLLVDGRVAGLLLGSTVEGLTRIESSIVAPDLRGQWTGGGWANLMMMAERLEWAAQRGSRRCRFSSLEGARPTRKLAAQAGAARVEVADFYRLMLG
jgi:GNAT superfamily N-acetyltransferase